MRILHSLLSLQLLFSAAHAQSLRPALQERLEKLTSSSGSSVLLWDTRGETVLAGVREEVFAKPHCVGSLIKPFLMLAYLRDHEPEIQKGSTANLRPCEGHTTKECPVECWYKPGHGRLEMRKALAVSCNQYFYQLAKYTNTDTFFQILTQFGVTTDSPQVMAVRDSERGAKAPPPEFLIGLDAQLKLVPMQVLRAYGGLINGSVVEERRVSKTHLESGSPVQLIIAALRLGAQSGTSVLAERALPPNQHLLAKTGTSPAVTGDRILPNKTDGWFLGFYPANEPTLAVLVYYPNGLGARNAAPLGGQAIRTYLDLVH